jgi:3',5'-cyclic AMP phosphodiesterase CpdA
MPTKIIHLSDIHLGNQFDLATWSAVRKVLKDERPHIIVVSGDLVDDPIPEQLLLAKCELRKLALDANNAHLCIVPGNHDVYTWGLGLKQKRSPWFERIFHRADTSDNEKSLVDRL